MIAEMPLEIYGVRYTARKKGTSRESQKVKPIPR